MIKPSETPSALMQELAEARRLLSATQADAQRYRMFLDSVQDYAFINLDLDGRVVGWSRGAERILGYPEADALGLSAAALFTPEDVARDEHAKELSQAREHGRAEDERWHVRQDGSRFWGSGVTTLLLDAANEQHGFSKVMRDYTRRRLTESQLRDSEERFRLFVENVGDYALVPVDPEGRVSGWNTGAERTFGYAEREILGEPAARFFVPEDVQRGESERDLQRALAEGRAEDERWMLRKDGSRFWSHWVTTPMRDHQGQLRGFAKVLRDETERRQAEELRARLLERERDVLRMQAESAAQALDRTKEELRALAGSLLGAQEEERRRIARELHDDLSQRLSLLEVGIARLRAAVPAELGSLHGELRRLEQGIGALADEVRRLSHRLHPAILDDLGLATALRRLVEEFHASRTGPIEFHADLAGPVPSEIAGALYRIAQEALRNVGKHAGDAAVRVVLRGQPGTLQLEIADGGPGFEPARVRGKGGLGIVSMHERARLVGGSLHVTSRPGAGTTIVVLVPAEP